MRIECTAHVPAGDVVRELMWRTHARDAADAIEAEYGPKDPDIAMVLVAYGEFVAVLRDAGVPVDDDSEASLERIMHEHLGDKVLVNIYG